MSNERTEFHNMKFLIVIGPNEPINAVLGQVSQTTVVIVDKNTEGSLILPLPPTLVRYQ